MYKILKIKTITIIFIIIFSVVIITLTVIYNLSSEKTILEKYTDSVDIDNQSNSLYNVYLTFDDGPSKITSKILEILKKYNIPATFFVTGYKNDKYNDIYNQIVNDGHAIGLHTYSHKYSKIYSSLDNYTEDLTQLEKLLEQIIGFSPKIVRMPGGSLNNMAQKSILKEIVGYLNKNQYVYFDWNVSGDDSKNYIVPSNEIFQKVIKTSKDKKNLIILLHDDELRKTTIEATEKIIKHFTELGYNFKKIVESTPSIQFNK